MATELINHTHPVTIAVEPARQESIEAAVAYASRLVARWTERLEAAGWDLEVAAPYPRSGMNKAQYTQAKALYTNLRRITKSTLTYCRRPHAPDPCVLSEQGIARFVQDCRDAASAQYDMFIVKMCKKIGECDSAELSGSHVWGYSFLTVKKGETVERWKTQQIINVSVLGTPFNQWPSRLVK